MGWVGYTEVREESGKPLGNLGGVGSVRESPLGVGRAPGSF